MASTPNVVSLDTSYKMAAWVEANSLDCGMDVLDQFLIAEEEAAQSLGYQAGDDWTNDPHVFILAMSRF